MKNEVCGFQARFAIVALAAFACLALTAIPARADTKTITCFRPIDDADRDLHARIGATPVSVTVDSRANSCPVEYLDVADDCNDADPNRHPRNWEQPYDEVSQTCNDAITDRPDFVYDALGSNNRTNSVTLTVWLKHSDIRFAAINGSLYADIRYFPLNDEGSLSTTARSHVTNFDAWKDQAILTLSGLQSATVYAIRVLFWKRDSLGNYFRVGPDSARYYTMTDSSVSSFHKRFQMVMKGLYEFHLSEIGAVGEAGSMSRNGTRYGADWDEAWCSEFYVWVTRNWLDGIDGRQTVAGLKEYFQQYGVLVDSDTSQLSNSPIGSYLAIDACGSSSRCTPPNHSGMLLHYDAGKAKVWTLEGNFNNQVKVVERTAASKIVKIGLITSGTWN